MIRFDTITKTDEYVELTTSDGQKMILPTSTVIFVEDESNDVSIKTIGSRKTIGLIPKSAL